MDFFSNVFSQFKGKEKKEWNAEEEIIPMRYFSPIDPLVLQMSGRGERRSRLTLQTVLGGSQPAKPSAVFCLSVPLHLTCSGLPGPGLFHVLRDVLC